MTAILARLAHVLGAGLIFLFFSEYFFLNEGPAFDLVALMHRPFSPAHAAPVELALYYAFLAAVFLACLDYFRVQSWSGLVLAAGVYGIATESLLVPAVYEALPISLGWTALSWHVLIDVLLGWWLLRRALRASALWGALTLTGLGLFWGIWATWIGAGDASPLLALGDFARLAGATALMLALGLGLVESLPRRWLTFPRGLSFTVALLAILLFGLTGAAYFPLSLVVAATVAILLAGLWAGRGRAMSDVLAWTATRVPAARFLLLPLLPASAVASYGLMVAGGLVVPVDLVTLPLLALGTAAVLAALAHAALTRFRAAKA